MSVHEELLQILKSASEPMTRGEILATFGDVDDKTKNTIDQALHSWKDSGKLTVIDDERPYRYAVNAGAKLDTATDENSARPETAKRGPGRPPGKKAGQKPKAAAKKKASSKPKRKYTRRAKTDSQIVVTASTPEGPAADPRELAQRLAKTLMPGLRRIEAQQPGGESHDMHPLDECRVLSTKLRAIATMLDAWPEQKAPPLNELLGMAA